MITIINLVLILILLVVCIFDLISKGKKIPAVLTIIPILVFYLIFGSVGMYFGIASFIFAYFLLQHQLIEGYADLKLIVLIGITISNIFNFIIYIFIILLVSFVYSFVLEKALKKKRFIFTPVFFIVYILLLLFSVV